MLADIGAIALAFFEFADLSVFLAPPVAPPRPSNCTVIVDAGSSGSRVHLYERQGEGLKLDGAFGRRIKFGNDLINDHGLDDFKTKDALKGNESALITYLNSMAQTINKAFDNCTLEGRNLTLVRGTGGLRTLQRMSRDDYGNLENKTKEVLVRQLVNISSVSVGTLQPKQEAYSAFLALNVRPPFESIEIKKDAVLVPVSDKALTAILEIGGSSMQTAAPAKTGAGIDARSWPGLGMDDFFKKLDKENPDRIVCKYNDTQTNVSQTFHECNDAIRRAVINDLPVQAHEAFEICALSAPKYAMGGALDNVKMLSATNTNTSQWSLEVYDKKRKTFKPSSEIFSTDEKPSEKTIRMPISTFNAIMEFTCNLPKERIKQRIGKYMKHKYQFCARLIYTRAILEKHFGLVKPVVASGFGETSSYKDARITFTKGGNWPDGLYLKQSYTIHSSLAMQVENGTLRHLRGSTHAWV